MEFHSANSARTVGNSRSQVLQGVSAGGRGPVWLLYQYEKPVTGQAARVARRQ